MQRRKPVHIAMSKNLLGYYAAIGIIILGYIVLAIGDADSLTSRTLGPIIIVIGYLIAVPAALLFGASEENKGETQPSSTSEITSSKKAS